MKHSRLQVNSADPVSTGDKVLVKRFGLRIRLYKLEVLHSQAADTC
jgi:hypothetical protein